MTVRRVYLDTSYAIALASPGDSLHAAAEAMANRLEREGAELVVNRAVLLEIGSALARARYRPAAVALIHSLEADPNVRVVPLSDDIYRDALALFASRQDKEWSLVDCVSFVVMRALGISEALTADEHFRQAGFIPLLRGTPPQ